jgi:hypothetical protein
MNTNTTRNANLTDLLALLKEQTVRKLDVVAPAATLHAEAGLLRVEGTQPTFTDDGLTIGDGLYRPTEVFDEGVANKLGVPVGYLKRLRVQRPDLYDANVNGWLHGHKGDEAHSIPAASADKRSFFVRTFQGDSGGVGVARALMSDRYSVIDNTDVLMATMAGINEAGVACDIDGADVTDRRMYVRVRCESVSALAPELLRGYRSPFGGGDGTENPTVFAGFVVSNSEVGNGSFSITPRLIVQVCSNGMTINKDAMRAVHVGAKLDEGIRWSAKTQDKALELIKLRTADAVKQFLDFDYMRGVIARITEDAAVEVPAGSAAQVVETVSRSLMFTQEQQDGILDHFIRGGQLTAGGVMHAVTSYAQTVEDADVSADLEGAGLKALALAAGR